jgi:hypothetical protein
MVRFSLSAKTAPPAPVIVEPRVSVRPDRVTSMGTATSVFSTWKMRDWRPASTVSTAAPGPPMARGSVIGISPEVSMIVPVRPGAKAIWSDPGAALASRIACRRLFGPEAARFETVNVAAVAPLARQSKRAQLIRSAGGGTRLESFFTT